MSLHIFSINYNYYYSEYNYTKQNSSEHDLMSSVSHSNAVFTEN